ncbi:AMP-binding protein [Gordonia soli]|uniref:Putative fatty-acid--CoA ligase n=1 Tax=Gordonia soli NBRC 108243 TaxID=1223545 RepID=M0QH84_9ACTN|nr:AMP-binding protein [Gordonia soli]GAC67888.1 putative fatty-acid--CoA ligase [Gordonia soli NBRC 108243]
MTTDTASPHAPSTSAGPTDIPLLTTTIGGALAETARTHPRSFALVDVPTDRRWTYRELLTDVDALASGLLDLGITTGDRVGIWAPNCAEWVLVQYATARIGAILVTINPAYRTEELSYVLRQAGIRTLICAPQFKSSDYPAMAHQVRADCPDLLDVLVIGDDQWDQVSHGSDTTASIEEIGQTLAPDDAINIQYTSGTTGFPKGATLSHRNILNNGYFVGELVHYTPDDRICVPVPFYHCFGMVMGNLAALTHAARIVIPAPAFDPAATLRAVADEHCTSLYGVPTMFIAMLNDPVLTDLDTSSLRTGIMAGSPCPIETMKQVIDTMGIEEISICYGMTETSPVSAQTRTDDSIHRRTATVGAAGPHIEISIVDPVTREILPRGEAGELCTRGYSVMLGYWEQPDKTAEAIDADRWMHTGDIAVMDDDGYLSITGRIKDMVIRGGENLYPREIEEFLITHPDVQDVQVIGVPDEKYGEELMAWIQMRAGTTALDVHTVRAFCDGRLARHKIPRYVHVVDAFPITITGKVRKVEMRAQAATMLGLSDQG